MRLAIHPSRAVVFFRAFMALLCVDCWSLMLSNAGEYGARGFNIAHFGWLDALTPTPAMRVVLIGGAGACAFVLAWVGPRASLTTCAAVLYNAGWAISLHDGFQHHYLLGLVTITLICWDAAERRGEAWPVALTLWSFAIVYGWTAVNKLDPIWRAGFVIHDLWGDELGSLRDVWLSLGLSERRFWSSLGHSAALVQLVIMAGYALAPFADTSGSVARRIRRWVMLPALGCALLFHVGADAMGLSIRLFGAYMTMAAIVWLCPCSVSQGVQRWAACTRRRVSHWLDGDRAASPALAMTACGAAAAAGFGSALPGGGLLGASAVSAWLLYYAAPRVRRALRWPEATGSRLARPRALLRGHALGVLMGATLFVTASHLSHAPFEVHDDLAKSALASGSYRDALRATRRARAVMPWGESVSVEEADILALLQAEGER